MSRTATLTDLSASGGTPGRNLSRVVVTQNLQTQRITAQVTLAATPTSDALAYVFLGTWAGDNCQAGAYVAGATTGSATGGRVALSNGTEVEVAVTRSRAGAVLTLTSAPHSRIREAAWDCAWAQTRETSGQVISGTYADGLVTRWTPKLQIDRGLPVQGSRKGRWTTVRVDLSNDGRGDAAGVRLAASGKGLKIKPRARTVGTVGDGATAYGLVFKVKITGDANQRPMTLTATASGGYRATAKVQIAVQPKPRKLPSLVGRYWWGHKPAQSDRGWDNLAIRFVSKRFARVGFGAKGAVPCRKASKQCRPYTYNPSTGTVKVKGLGRGKANTQALKLGKQSYYPLTVPRPNTKLDVDLHRDDFRGLCGVYCYTWTERIILTRDGRFVRSERTIISLGTPGSGSGSIFATASPDERGRYQVLSRGRIRLSYDDGTTKVHSIGIGHDVRERPSPAGVGIILDADNFYL
ncbi:hypothetical protein [Nocardioides sp. GXZ039]|uniref:hypothetical protein n=1 Tax=Nocardioides sp. GXZ039 TaxID=3136018 RepID=UPI0030F45077